MPRVDDRLVRQPGQGLKALVHLLRIGTRQIRTAASVEKKRVARNKTTTGKETLTSRRVARRVHESDVDLTDRQRVACSVRDEM